MDRHNILLPLRLAEVKEIRSTLRREPSRSLPSLALRPEDPQSS